MSREPEQIDLTKMSKLQAWRTGWHTGVDQGWRESLKYHNHIKWIWLIAGAGLGALLVGLLACAPVSQQRIAQLPAAACVVAIDTVIVTGTSGQRIGLERRRCEP